MKIAVAAESDAGEPQAAATPHTIRKMVALGADVAVEPAGPWSHIWGPNRRPEIKADLPDR
jgi:NAD/NADP transhydrogenase alpha subunit